VSTNVDAIAASIGGRDMPHAIADDPFRTPCDESLPFSETRTIGKDRPILTHSVSIKFLAAMYAVISATACGAADVEYAGCQLITEFGRIDCEVDRESGVSRALVDYAKIHSFWSLRQGEKGWVISCIEFKPRGPEAGGANEPEIRYLSYRTREPANKNDGATPLVYLSDSVEQDSYWKIEIQDVPIDDLVFFIRPIEGEFAGWYLSPGERIGDQPREMTLRRLKDWVKRYRGGYDNRTIKYSRGCLNIEEGNRRIVFQQNTSGYKGIWFASEGKQGWLISRAINHSVRKQKPAYLSYRPTKDEKQDADGKLPDAVFLSESPHENSYWRLDIKVRGGNDFHCYMRPMCGEYEGWYLTAGDELGPKTTPGWAKKSTAIFKQEKPAEPLSFLIDGA